MAKTGRQYGDELRELREAGFDFPASRGYLLANPAQWSSGLKSAVTRATNSLQQERADDTEPDRRGDEQEIGEFFDVGFGEPDSDDEFDDVDFFDLDQIDDFIDDENDDYEDDT